MSDFVNSIYKFVVKSSVKIFTLCELIVAYLLQNTCLELYWSSTGAVWSVLLSYRPHIIWVHLICVTLIMIIYVNLFNM